jgi:hypothetical protein
VLFGCAVGEALRDGVVAAPEPARPIDHWRSVGGVLAAFLGSEVVAAAGWPTAGLDRRAAFEVVRRARPALRAAAERDRPAHTAGLPALIAGAQGDLPSLTHFSGVVPDRPSVWDTYLTYTSLRYLDLCLETPA